jgi:sulfonate dioxygenase
VPGGYDVTLREGKRTAIYGERPFFDPENSESLTQRKERLKAEAGVNGIAHKTKDVTLNN